MKRSSAQPQVPRKEPESELRVLDAPGTPDPDCAGCRGKIACRVLVVDDHATIAESIARALRKQGYEVRTASDGLAALEQSKTFRPHIVFSDIALPRMDGLTLASRVREVPCLRDTVLVAVTGFEDEDTMEAVRQTFDYCLIKPPELAAMNALIRSAVSHADEG